MRRELHEIPLTAKQRHALQAVANDAITLNYQPRGWLTFYRHIALGPHGFLIDVTSQITTLRRRGLIAGHPSRPMLPTLAGIFELYFDATEIAWRLA